MDKIASGIILYNPDIVRLKENLDSIYKQVELIVLVDNCSNNIEEIEREVNIYKNIVMIKNKNNKGIAAALNQAVSICKERGYDWILTLDQDSVCPENIIEEYSKYTGMKNIGIISPYIIDRNIKINKKSNDNKKYEYIEKCITSASLTNIYVWDLIGKFDEEMFIDMVDFDYCKRIIINGYKIIRVNTVELLHEIGNIVEHKLFGINIMVKNHSAFRKYYISRNTIYYTRKYENRINLIKSYMRVLKIAILVLFYEKDKFNKLKNIAKGFKDGVFLKVKKYTT